MPKQRDDDTRAYGLRLRDVREALGCPSRPALARFLGGPLKEEKIRRLADNIRKYEDGAAEVPPKFVIWIGERAQEPGVMDYVYKDLDGRLTEDFRLKVRAARAARQGTEA